MNATINLVFDVVLGGYSLLAFLAPGLLEHIKLPVAHGQRFWYLVIVAICATNLSGSASLGFALALLAWLADAGLKKLKGLRK